MIWRWMPLPIKSITSRMVVSSMFDLTWHARFQPRIAGKTPFNMHETSIHSPHLCVIIEVQQPQRVGYVKRDPLWEEE
jgi:hypothetical protein